MEKISNFLKEYNLKDFDYELYNDKILKINFKNFSKFPKKGKLILFTAINPTKYGEGKTTCCIGIADAFTSIGKKTMLALREPSMGPVFGSKGTATGGGECIIMPEDVINLNFTGDIHAITSANNLISSAIDSHIYWKNKLDIDIDTISWQRCLDVNDRALREVEIRIAKNIYRKESFRITAASDIMTILSLSKDENDLRERLNNVVFALDKNGKELKLSQLKIVGSVMAILKKAIYPNLVFTKYNTPSLVHCGPFANIATGTNSLIATSLALKLADFVVTECGFGSELGFEKFINVVNKDREFLPDVVCLVATVRALKLNNDYENNFSHLSNHIKNITQNNLNIVVIINVFQDDKDDDLNSLKLFLEEENINFGFNYSYTKGPKGAIDIVQKIMNVINNNKDFNPVLKQEMSLIKKIKVICNNYYHQKNIFISTDVENKIKEYNLKYKNWPVVFAKSQNSIDGNDKHMDNYKINISDLKINTGGKFIIVLTNKMLLMPGLPEKPNYEDIDLVDDSIVNLK